MSLPLRCLVLLALSATPACAQQQKQSKTPEPMMALATDALAGQLVAVLPLTMVVSDPRLPGGTGLEARTRTMRWADSLLGDVLQERAPEVEWILPPALRRTAERAVGVMPSPDKMGQSVMRSATLRSVPDPLRAYLRQLVALSGGARFALIPAVLYLTPASGDSITVQLSAVLADGRLGRVMWRTLAKGTGETAEIALRQALATILASDAPPPPSP
ncbi:MAG TPA: hypothetical protein VGP87_04605 [Gemmatimonadales bacterium]|jgi:hypothetical protein|nr:hypothetical protein [Gemmatimonadales bacterium]